MPPLLNSGRTELEEYCFVLTLASDKGAILREADVGHQQSCVSFTGELIFSRKKGKDQQVRQPVAPWKEQQIQKFSIIPSLTCFHTVY